MNKSKHIFADALLKYHKKSYGNLLSKFIFSFKQKEIWINEILPLLKEIRSGKLIGKDLQGFEWGGTVCFRKDYVMILDPSINQEGRVFPDLKDENGNIITVNDIPLFDTNFIEKNYTEYFKISLSELENLIKLWLESFSKVTNKTPGSLFNIPAFLLIIFGFFRLISKLIHHKLFTGQAMGEGIYMMIFVLSILFILYIIWKLANYKG